MSRVGTGRVGQRPFYGWAVVGVAFLALVAGTAAGPSAFSVFVKPMTDDLGWDRAVLSGGLSLGTLVGGLVAPALGPLIDRFGTRLMLSAAGVGMGGALLALALTSSPLSFYLAYGVARAVDMSLINVGATTAVANWFVRQRGRALGLALLGSSVGLAAMVPVSQWIIETAGWRTAWAVLGAGCALILTPAAWLIVRRRPEDLGLQPDGERAPSPDGQPRPAPARAPADWTLRAALRARAYWLLVAVTTIGLAAAGGMSTHQVALLVDNGLPAAVAAGAVSVQALAWMAGNLLWGFAVERVAARAALALIYLLAAGAAALVVVAQTPALALLYGVGYGLAVAGLETVEAVVWADYFGRASLGAIRGFTRPFLLGGNAAGTFAAGLVYDRAGSYGPAFIGFALLLALGAGIVLRLPRAEAAQSRGAGG